MSRPFTNVPEFILSFHVGNSLIMNEAVDEFVFIRNNYLVIYLFQLVKKYVPSTINIGQIFFVKDLFKNIFEILVGNSPTNQTKYF